MEILQTWRVADVRPVLKAGKDAQCLDSLSANLPHLVDGESYGEASN